MLKRITIILVTILLIIEMCGNVSAAEFKTRLDIIQKESETKYLENDQGFISKTIVDSNAETGEITIELKLSNAKNKETKAKYDNTEIYILISENAATSDSKLEKNINNIETLANKIFKYNSNTKIGIIGIKGTISDKVEDENGNVVFGDKDESEVLGTENNAEIVSELTNNIESIKSRMQNMNIDKNLYHINLQAAIRLANKSFSNNSNKILISIYDGVPSIAIGVKTKVEYGSYSEYSTPEEAVKGKHEIVATNTKDEILSLRNSDVSFILLRPDDTSYDEEWYNISTGEKELDFDGSPYVQKLYGTIDNPTYGKMYSFDETNIDSIITENMYIDVKELIQADISTVKIVDYFPENITDNFEFSYVGSPSIGITSDSIDTESKTITWDIGTLKGDEVATLRYKLKIKDMKNVELLNKTIATNEKVVLTYKDIEGKDYTVELTSSPKIQLSEIKEEITANEKDNTTAPSTLPQTGLNIADSIASIITFAVVLFIFYKKYNNYKDLK